jgi:hypothetical protein
VTELQSLNLDVGSSDEISGNQQDDVQPIIPIKRRDRLSAVATFIALLASLKTFPEEMEECVFVNNIEWVSSVLPNLKSRELALALLSPVLLNWTVCVHPLSEPILDNALAVCTRILADTFEDAQACEDHQPFLPILKPRVRRHGSGPGKSQRKKHLRGNCLKRIKSQCL